jgi:hypothetical protein
MMNKAETLKQLRQARTGHIRWRTYAQSILNAPNHLDDISAKAPVNHTECDFGRWYFSHLESLGHLPGYRDIDPLHEELHQLYRQIFDVMLEKKSGTFARLLGGEQRQQQKCLELAKPLMAQLEDVSHRLLLAIDALQESIYQYEETA